MREKIKKILVAIKEDPDIINDLTDDSDIINDLISLDSIQIINFMLKIEEEFDIEIDYDNFDYSYISSIDEFCKFLAKQKSTKNDNW